jgi:hypothetical protein
MFHPFAYAGPVRIPPAKLQLRVRREANPDDTINARQFESWQSSVPVLQGGQFDGAPPEIKPAFYDMAPLSSRTDKQDYRQSQPFVANGPSLAMNPYFDRYDPTRDPRNMIREVRSVVYEEKEADRGLAESRRLNTRAYTSRWVPEGVTADSMRATLQAYEVMRPKTDNIEEVYRPQKPINTNDTVISTYGSGSGSGST